MLSSVLRPLAALLLGIVPALAQTEQDGADGAPAEIGGVDDHLAEIGDIRILHAWTRATETDSAAVFMEIENEGGDSVTLRGGSAGSAGIVTLVAPSIKAGDLTAETIDAIPVRPGTELMLQPQGLHFMLSRLDGALEQGDSFPMTVMLDPAGEVEVVVEVEAADATQHSHAGHAH